PAVIVGGQRRRLARRTKASRSNTMPVLGSDLENAKSSNATHSTREEEAANSAPAMDYPVLTLTSVYSPLGGTPTNFTPSHKPRPSKGSKPWPTPNLASPSITAMEGKRKHGLFDGLKSNDHDRPGSSHASPMPTSPLPTVTPCKAAQVLGLPSTISTIVKPIGGSNDGVQFAVPVRPALHKQSSMPLLTKIKSVTSKQTRFKEEGVKPDPPKSKRFPWKGGKKKALKMFDLLPSLGSSSKRAASQGHEEALSILRRSEEVTDQGYSSDSDLHVRPRLPSITSRPSLELPNPRTRTMGLKSFDRLSSITETSHEEVRSVYRNSDHATELDVISEYETYSPSYNAPLQLPPRVESLLTTNIRYELAEDDLSLTDQVIEEVEYEDEDSEDKEQEHVMHPGTRVDLSHVRWKKPLDIHLRGPMQTVEDKLLDAAELEFRAQKRSNESDTDKPQLDTKNAMMAVPQQQTTPNLKVIKDQANVHDKDKHLHECHTHKHHCIHACQDHGIEDSEDDDDLVSLRSSIDLDEEPTVHVAKLMTFTRITPGMAKLVDIPPRTKKPNPAVAPVPVGTAAHNVKPTDSFQKDPVQWTQREYGGKKILLGLLNNETNVEQPKISAMSLPTDNYSDHANARKPKMPREESRMLVQDWITKSPRPAEQRPVSERIDLDVLADQQIPPAPFPKEDRPIPPPRQPSKHLCLSNGHVFHPIDLKKVPDEATINELEVRPYLQTHVGAKQHVQIPVPCEKCGLDVKEQLWECEIAVCRMVVCKECAKDMEHERKQRAIGAWAH
ncbi:hypothetical protein BKA66DRAFT_587369, partial [Pyrenochaeta sp. MPI-SDFR-AT-0127]